MRGDKMIRAIIGFVAGAYFGMITMSLCVVAGRADHAEEKKR